MVLAGRAEERLTHPPPSLPIGPVPPWTGPSVRDGSWLVHRDAQQREADRNAALNTMVLEAEYLRVYDHLPVEPVRAVPR